MVSGNAAARSGDRSFAALVPLPRRVEPGEGFLELGRDNAVAAPPGLAGAAALAAAWLGEAWAAAPGDAARTARFRAVPAGARAAAVELLLDPAIREDEGYVLEVGPTRVTARCATHEGAVRAASTLRQLALSAEAGPAPRLPRLRIEDSPRFPWRGAMLDCARNFFRVEFIERFLDLMALHKLDRFHWHLTDDQAWRLDLPGLPELAAKGSRRRDLRVSVERWKEGSYSPADVRRVVACAAERGIVVVPEIETPGHAVALLASHPELSCAGRAAGGGPFEPEDRYGVFEDILCAGNDGVFELLGRVYDGVAELFPGPWVHAGGDEAPKARWLACPRCRARMEALGLRKPDGSPDAERLQGWFMNRVAGLLAERGKRMVGWDEILEGGVGKDAVIMSWRGESGGIEAARAGYEAVMSPQTKACYLDHQQLDIPEEPGQLGVCTVRNSYEFDPVPPSLAEVEAARILGGQANLWSELLYFGKQVEYMAFPRLCALSEVFWSPREARDFEDFRRRLEVHGPRLDRLGVDRYRGPLD